jgi:hypothetical protein
MQRGQSTAEIADDLLEDEENVQRICDAAKKYGGDEDKIYEAVCGSTYGSTVAAIYILTGSSAKIKLPLNIK